MKELNVTINFKKAEADYLAIKEEEVQELMKDEGARQGEGEAIEKEGSESLSALNEFIKVLKQSAEQEGLGVLKAIGMIKDSGLRNKEIETYIGEMLNRQWRDLAVVKAMPLGVLYSPAYIALNYNLIDFVANSIDAGATEINVKISCESDAAGLVKIVFEDNGKGFPKTLFPQGKVECDAREPFGVGTAITSDKKDEEAQIGGAGMGMRRATQFLTHKKGEIVGNEAFILRDDKDVGGKLMLSNQGPRGGARLVFESPTNAISHVFVGFYGVIKKALVNKAQENVATKNGGASTVAPVIKSAVEGLALLTCVGDPRTVGLGVLRLGSSLKVDRFPIEAPSDSDSDSEEEKAGVEKGMPKLRVPCKSIFKVEEIEYGSDEEDNEDRDTPKNDGFSK